VAADGRGKAYIQGRLATVRELREVGDRLVSVAGQHAFTSLASPRERLAMLDASAGTAAPLSAYAKRFRAWREAARALEELRAREADRATRQDYLEYVVAAVEAVRPVTGEIEALGAQLAVLRGAQRLKELAAGAGDALYEGVQSAFDAASRALLSVREMARIDPGAGELAARVESIQIEAREASRDLGAYAERLSDDPGRLAAAEERLEAVRGLAKRFGGSVEGC